MYIVFYASGVRLAGHRSGGIQLSCGTYEARRSATWNQRDRLTGFEPVRAKISMEQQLLFIRNFNTTIIRKSGGGG